MITDLGVHALKLVTAEYSQEHDQYNVRLKTEEQNVMEMGTKSRNATYLFVQVVIILILIKPII